VPSEDFFLIGPLHCMRRQRALERRHATFFPVFFSTMSSPGRPRSQADTTKMGECGGGRGWLSVWPNHHPERHTGTRRSGGVEAPVTAASERCLSERVPLGVSPRPSGCDSWRMLEREAPQPGWSDRWPEGGVLARSGSPPRVGFGLAAPACLGMSLLYRRFFFCVSISTAAVTGAEHDFLAAARQATWCPGWESPHAR